MLAPFGSDYCCPCSQSVSFVSLWIKPCCHVCLGALQFPLQFHNEVQRKYKAAVDKFGPNLATWPSSSDPAVAAARRDVLTFVLHVADVSNVLKPRDMAVSWAKRFLQGESLTQRLG